MWWKKNWIYNKIRKILSVIFVGLYKNYWSCLAHYILKWYHDGWTQIQFSNDFSLVTFTQSLLVSLSTTRESTIKTVWFATNTWRNNDPRGNWEGQGKAEKKSSRSHYTKEKRRLKTTHVMRINKPKPRLFKLQTSKSPLLLSTRGRARQQRTAPLPRIYNKKLLTTSQRKVNKMGNFQLKLVLLLFTVCAALGTLSTAQDFKCSAQTAARCQALVGYLPPNKTTISEIQSLFTVKNLRSILGANNFPPGTPRNFSVPAQKPIKVPIHCICSNGTGAFLFPLSLSSDDTPLLPQKKTKKKKLINLLILILI